MINSYDPRFKDAINNLRKNLHLAPYIKEMEGAGLNVFVVQGAPAAGGSQTYVYSRPVYTCLIHTKGDAGISLQKYKVTLTTEENSIAHELGHVYFDYALNIKKTPSLVATLAKPPKGATAEQWEVVLTECMSRRFELYSRPPGTIIPLKDPIEEGFFERLDFAVFPYSLFKK